MEKQKVKCLNCSYTWETKSIMTNITCPNCQRKFNPSIQDEAEIKQKKSEEGKTPSHLTFKNKREALEAIRNQ